MSSDTTMELKTREPLIQGSMKTHSGTLHWDFSEHTPVTLHGHLPFFAQFLETGNLFSDWVEDAPLAYASNNAPKPKDVLGTILLSVLSGHKRYCHSSALYGDQVAPALLGLSKIVSHDSLSRGLKKMDADLAEDWLHTHLLRKTEPLLQHAYVLDLDATVKTVYGAQEGSEIGYNPHKPGRPSYCYHTYMVGTARLVMDVDVLPGNRTAGCYSHPGLWRILDGLPPRLSRYAKAAPSRSYAPSSPRPVPNGKMPGRDGKPRKHNSSLPGGVGLGGLYCCAARKKQARPSRR